MPTKLEEMIAQAKARLAAKQASEAASTIDQITNPLLLRVLKTKEENDAKWAAKKVNEAAEFDPYSIDGKVLNDKQREAVLRFGINGESGVIIGPAGTGKTTTMKAVIQAAIYYGRIPKVSDEFVHKHHHSDFGIWCGSFTKIATRNLRDNMPEEIKSATINIHQLLEFEPIFDTITGDDGNPKNIMRFEPSRTAMRPLPPEFTTFVTDEGSMVSTKLDQQRRNAISAESYQDIYIGDLAQLPPVFDDAILGFKLLELPVIELTEVYRHSGRIVNLANAIRVGKTIPPKAKILPFLGLKMNQIPRDLVEKSFEEWNGEEDGSKVTLKLWSKRHKNDEDGHIRALQGLGKFFEREWKEGLYMPVTDMILIPFNVSVGTVELNKFIADFIDKAEKRVVHEIVAGRERHYMAVGDKVFYEREEGEISKIEKNSRYAGRRTKVPSEYLNRWGSYRQSLSKEEVSGDMDSDFADIDALLASPINDDEKKNQASHVITVKKYGEEREYELNTTGEINELLAGYALTVHKSQGSQWRKVYCVFHNSHNKRLQRELLYTAITRAQKELYVICEPETFILGVDSQHIKGNTIEAKAEHFKGKKKQLDLNEANSKRILASDMLNKVAKLNKGEEDE